MTEVLDEDISPVNVLNRLSALAQVPNAELVISLAQLPPKARATMYFFEGVLIDIVKRSERSVPKQNLSPHKTTNVSAEEKLTRRLHLIRTEAVQLQHQLDANPKALDFTIDFTVHHSFADMTVAQLAAIAKGLLHSSQKAHTLHILSKVEFGKIILHLRERNAQAVSEFSSLVGISSSYQLAYRYCTVSNLCKSYPLLPFLRAITWSFLGQYSKQIHHFLRANDDIGDILSQPPPSIARSSSKSSIKTLTPARTITSQSIHSRVVLRSLIPKLTLRSWTGRTTLILFYNELDTTEKGATPMLGAGFEVNC